MLDKGSQAKYLEKIESGDFDLQILSPPCGTWSRANFSNNAGPKSCRDRQHPWGKPSMPRHQRGRAERGNEFIPFSIRAIAAARDANSRGFRTKTIWEHPEDLGKMHSGEPASVWQLPETRSAFGNSEFTTIAFHQCRFGVDRSKPTRIYTDVMGFESEGHAGWPSFDAADYYKGPLPR